ncbi:MAG: Rieske 2Fe-2S domain-containing protein [Candidatus Binatia bacterium]
MLSQEENRTLTQVGPGTPMGELLRRYWYPVAAASELMRHRTKVVKILGESLVLYRDREGCLGLIGDTCPHRRVSLIYGIPETDGLRCAYHGWKFDRTGKCIEMPAEPHDSTFKEKVRIPSYPVQELGGMIFAYLGPEPAPLIPRWELFVRDDVPKAVGAATIPCNWVQIMENSVDPVHVEWLHRHFYNYVMRRLNREETCIPVHHERIGFEIFKYGIIKRRVLEGDTDEHENWKVGHPIVFPNMLLSGSARSPVYQIRVPIDDTHTQYYWYSCQFSRADVSPHQPEDIRLYSVPVPALDANRQPQWELLDNNAGQDNIMWLSQGPMADRSLEKLGESDQGVILFRKLLVREMEKARRNEDPMNVFRDVEENVCITFSVEENKAQRSFRAPRAGNTAKYNPVLTDLETQGSDMREVLTGARET